MKKITALLSLSLLLIANAFAADNTGTAAMSFLKVGQGVRALAMGGAFVAVDKDIDSIWWNPAGAASIDAMQVNAAYSTYIADMSGSYASIVWPKSFGNLLASFNYVSLGEVEGTDATGTATKTINPTNMAATLGVAIETSDSLSIGVTAKSVQQDLGEYTSSGLAADAGVLLKLSDVLNIGFSIQNVGPEIKTSDVSNKLPTNMRAGIAYAFSPKILIAADGEKPNDSDTKTHAGIDYKFSESFSVRAGYTSGDEGGITYGAGILTPINLKENGDSPWWKEAVNTDWKHNVVSIDYAYITSKTFDATHRVALTLRF